MGNLPVRPLIRTVHSVVFAGVLVWASQASATKIVIGTEIGTPELSLGLS